MARRSKALVALGAAFAIFFAWFFSSDVLTDSATRAAYDMEEAAAKLQRSSASSFTLVHRPKPSPSGCEHGYTIQFSQQSILVIWCKSASGDRNVASHGTTYHLNFVDVPETTILEKAAGEPVTIELRKTGAKPAVSRVY